MTRVEKKIPCPFCSFQGSSHGSMVIHFGNRHPSMMRSCPAVSLWDEKETTLKPQVDYIDRFGDEP